MSGIRATTRRLTPVSISPPGVSPTGTTSANGNVHPYELKAVPTLPPFSSPTVGVVMPAHNAAIFIEQALASIAGKSYRPTRVIVVDDASTDETGDLAESWADRLPLTVLRLGENIGSGAARQRAIALLDTDLLAPLDADDVWLPDHLEHLVGLWCKHPSVVSARAEVWRPGQPRVDYHRSLGLRIPKGAQLPALLADNFVFFGSVFSREEYERVGGFGNHRGWEDWDLWVKMAANQVPITVAEFPTVLYRRHESNLTQDITALDQGLIARITELRAEHPEWLEARVWDAVLRYRRAVLHLNKATALLQQRRLSGVVELTRAVVAGRGRILGQIVRQGVYRVVVRGPRFR